MRRLAVLAALILGLPGIARADRLDFRLYKLGDPDAAVGGAAANARFTAFVNELGCALVNFNLEPPETTGFSGFNFAFEYPVALINAAGTINGVAYWPFSNVDSPPSVLQMPGIHVRKGLPFSFEAGAKVNYITQSSMVSATVEAKWALNEGFIYFPDLDVRGFGTQLIGAREFNLTVAGLDLGIGKQFPIAGMFTLTPYAGWTSIWVAASSNVVDIHPDQSEQQQFTDANGQASAFGTESNRVFASVDLGKYRHNRFYGGVRFISYIVEVGLEVSVAQVRTEVIDYDVVTYSGKLGLDF